jgi:predicted lipoprotein with Yx(FWY)xxD motif
MRLVLTSVVAASFALTASVALAQPPGVQQANGGLASGDGKALYTFDNDQPGKSLCTGPCNNFWPPFAAQQDAKPAGDWTIITRDDGSKQWAHKGKPVYVFSRDLPGKPPMGESVQSWKMIRQ